PTYLCGDTVIVEAIPDPVWLFDGWSDGLSGTENPDTIAMMSDTTITATFVPDTFLVSVTTTPIDLEVIVDSIVYTAPRQFASAYGTSHEIGVPSPQEDADTVYVFSDWSDGGAITHTIVVPDSNPTYTANFAKYFKFALIDSIVDVPDDQGGWVEIHVTRSWYDSVDEENFPIEKYKVWRRTVSLATTQPLTGEGQRLGAAKTTSLDNRSGKGSEMLSDLPLVERQDRYVRTGGTELQPADFPPGTWELVDSFPAAQLDHYVHVSATLGDSSDIGLPFTSYAVSAHSTTPTEWFMSPPDSGYSVDNIFPAVPANFEVAYNTGSGNHLTWAASGDPDLREFRIYRSNDPDFTPTPTDLVHTTTDNEWYDPDYDGWNVYYKITAVDDAGNESGPATDQAPTTVTEPVIPKKLALYQNTPNPFNPTTVIRFDVPNDGTRVTLAIYNVSGRLVRSIVDGNVTAGRKSVTWDGTDTSGNPVSSGVYFYRLATGKRTITKKMVLLK
ncbi:MAG: T9SS type A sorting domain-containing protein, partial [Candidatus Latescibacterota bacterium]